VSKSSTIDAKKSVFGRGNPSSVTDLEVGVVFLLYCANPSYFPLFSMLVSLVDGSLLGSHRNPHHTQIDISTSHSF